MFMCLTHTGDLLADAFISGYSKIVNFFYRKICRNKFQRCLTDRESFEHTDVIRSLLVLIFHPFVLLV